jgi:hypothetical protein
VIPGCDVSYCSVLSCRQKVSEQNCVAVLRGLVGSSAAPIEVRQLQLEPVYPTNVMQQSPSGEANGRSASVGIFHCLFNPIVHYDVHKSSAAVLRFIFCMHF